MPRSEAVSGQSHLFGGERHGPQCAVPDTACVPGTCHLECVSVGEFRVGFDTEFGHVQPCDFTFLVNSNSDGRLEDEPHDP